MKLPINIKLFGTLDDITNKEYMSDMNVLDF